MESDSQSDDCPETSATLSKMDMQQCPKRFCNFVQKVLAKNTEPSCYPIPAQERFCVAAGFHVLPHFLPSPLPVPVSYRFSGPFQFCGCHLLLCSSPYGMGRRRMRFRCCTDIFFHPPTASVPSGYFPWTGIGITGFIIFELILCIRTLRFRIRGIIIDPLSFGIGDIF